MKYNRSTALVPVTAGLACCAALTVPTAQAGDEGWMERFISPVANPIFFESPQITSEVRPLFIQHDLPDDFVGGGDVRVYALQLRLKLSERLALIATKDGYIELNANGIPHQDGWADIAAGLKYAVVDDREKQFIVTPGFTFEVPTGNNDVFQGNGDGEWNLFVSAAKGWDNFHATGNVGVRLPNNWSEETASLHYSLQLDYYTCQYFIPFVVMNGYTVISEGNQLPFDTEGYDLINFGSQNASGWTGLTLGCGFRTRLCKNLDLGFAWEKAVASPKGLFDDRYTVDLIFRF